MLIIINNASPRRCLLGGARKEVSMDTDIITLLKDYLGAPVTPQQENLLYFFGFFLLVFVISCIFDIITNLTKM